MGYGRYTAQQFQQRSTSLIQVISSRHAATDVLRDEASEEPLATDGAESSCCRLLNVTVEVW